MISEFDSWLVDISPEGNVTKSTEPRDAQIQLDRAMEAADDRGMEMFAKLVVFGTAAVIGLTTLWLAWPFLEKVIGGLS